MMDNENWSRPQGSNHVIQSRLASLQQYLDAGVIGVEEMAERRKEILREIQ